MSGTQETALTLARELSGAGEAEEALLELLCQAAEQQWETVSYTHLTLPTIRLV